MLWLSSCSTLRPEGVKNAIRFCLALTLTLTAPVAAESPSFLTFESGQVRPLALTPAGDRLLAVNTPDGRLEVLDVTNGLRVMASVPVGLEPVAVAARDDDEAWVVNHLSDSVSIVDLAADPPRVVRTLLVGDEPADVVFAGPGNARAFITAAHRGQHRSHPSIAAVPGAGDPRLTTPGIGRADVWVFDAADPGPGVGGTPLRIVELFGDTPRALATSPDRATVYAAVFRSGNRTTTIPEGAVCDGFDPTDLPDACPQTLAGVPGGLPGPAAAADGTPAPEVGLIVRRDAAGRWLDELDRDWSAAVRFDLPDLDVFALDAETLEERAAYAGVGTVLFNLATNPVTGTLYVSNTEARNEVRFEGTAGATTLQGRLAETRITVIAEATPERLATVAPRHLNKHLDYALRPAPAGAADHSLATPLGMAVSSDGATLYVAAFGSSRIGVFDVAALESDGFDPETASAGYLEIAGGGPTGGGPTGLVLDEPRDRLYVLTRFDNAVSAIDLATGAETARVALPSPEPDAVVEGRPLLYDARRTSSNGEASCASCHVFGDLDALAWNLGDPGAAVTKSPLPLLRREDALRFDPPINGSGEPEDFHPLKGPMVTQTLRGLASSGAMHWRGDRANGFFGTGAGAELSLRNFIVAFESLLGRAEPLPEDDMDRLADFLLALVPPPNPVRRLDNTLDADQAAGRLFFDTRLADGGIGARRCSNCHILEPLAGRFGTQGIQAFSGETQVFKVPHLRGLYRKVGMFGAPPLARTRPGDNEHQGDQVRGIGFLHDGSVDTIFRFLNKRVFDPDGDVGFHDDAERRQVERYLLAFETDLAPIVGQQVTLAGENAATRERLDLLIERASTPYVSAVLGGVVTECDLVFKGILDGATRGGLYDPVTRRFRLDRKLEPVLAAADLRARAARPGQALTFTCAPPGSGRRIGLDRDQDGHLDRDERDAGSDPADPASVPQLPDVAVAPRSLDFGDVATGAISGWRALTIKNAGAVALRIVALGGLERSFFLMRGDCAGKDLAPAATCRVEVRFAPAFRGATSATLTVLSTDPDEGKLRVGLRGRGI